MLVRRRTSGPCRAVDRLAVHGDDHPDDLPMSDRSSRPHQLIPDSALIMRRSSLRRPRSHRPPIPTECNDGRLRLTGTVELLVTGPPVQSSRCVRPLYRPAPGVPYAAGALGTVAPGGVRTFTRCATEPAAVPQRRTRTCNPGPGSCGHGTPTRRSLQRMGVEGQATKAGFCRPKRHGPGRRRARIRRTGGELVPRRLAVMHHANSFFPLELRGRVGECAELVWVVNSRDQPRRCCASSDGSGPLSTPP